MKCNPNTKYSIGIKFLCQSKSTHLLHPLGPLWVCPSLYLDVKSQKSCIFMFSIDSLLNFQWCNNKWSIDPNCKTNDITTCLTHNNWRWLRLLSTFLLLINWCSQCEEHCCSCPMLQLWSNIFMCDCWKYLP